MKIAILTLPLHTNYGGILQAYALQKVLQNHGHEVDVLQKTPSLGHSPWVMPIVFSKRLIQKILLDRNTQIFFERKSSIEKPILERNVLKFITRNINLRSIKTFNEISSSDYDAIVVGSDQVWRKKYFKGLWRSNIADAFLEFTRSWDIKRIAYAASFGLDNINEYTHKDISRCRDALKRFNTISVREDSGIQTCQKYFGVDAQHVLDPTMLLGKEEYIRIIEQPDVPISNGDMLCYILDQTPFKKDMISKIAREKHLTPFNVGVDVGNYSIPIENRIQPPIESWLRGFMDAKFIVTDSFHACVFSIIFEKPFIVIGNSERGMSRFTSLLKLFNYEDRLITEHNFHKKIPDLFEMNPHIFDQYRNKSKEILLKNLI